MRALDIAKLSYQYNTDKEEKTNQNELILVLCYVKRDQTYISRLLLPYWTLDSESIQEERVNSNRKVWRSEKKSNAEGKKKRSFVGM
jgi:uncharacterized protein YdaU (DUF1376 family)